MLGRVDVIERACERVHRAEGRPLVRQFNVDDNPRFAVLDPYPFACSGDGDGDPEPSANRVVDSEFVRGLETDCGPLGSHVINEALDILQAGTKAFGLRIVDCAAKDLQKR